MDSLFAFETEVKEEDETVDPGIAKIRDWVLAMGKRGEYPPSTARFRATALKRFAEVLADDEPRDPKWLLQHLDDLGRRYANKENPKSDTLNSYLTRARTALQDFIAYQTDPAAFKGRGRKTAPNREPRRRETPSVVRPVHSDAEASSSSTDTSAQATDAPKRARTYPLEEGREFSYTLPRDGADVKDILKFALHLVTMARDFDPFNVSQQASLFALKTVRDDD